MDLCKDKISKLYFKYFIAAFGSAFASSILGIVDMVMLGQYQGSSGTAALAVVAPLWNVIYSLGLLLGIGGSVILSSIRGKGEDTRKEENEFFTVSLINGCIVSILVYILFFAFEDQILTFFGADSSLLIICKDYVKAIRFGLPLFLFNQLLSSFLRNDNDPLLATIAVLAGGIFNVFGDYIFVFPLDMGAFGAGLSTVIGAFITFCVLLSHFFKKKNTLKIVKPTKFLNKTWEIFKNGFSSFFVDAAMGILTILFNNQIMRYLDSDALSIYGVIINISTFVQCCAYSVGQASQPIISINLGAKEYDRIKSTLKYALFTILIISLFWFILSESIPSLYIKIFIKDSENITQKASEIIRIYSISFLLLPLNIFSTYYFQALLKPLTSFIVCMARGIIISGALIMILPLIKPMMIFLSMPFTEIIVAIYVVIMMIFYTKKLKVSPSV